MSRGILFDPVNYIKRPPYAEGKPQGPLLGTVLGCPDNVYLKEKFSNSIKLGTFLGFNFGLFGTFLKSQPALTYAKDKFLFYAVKSGEHALRGAIMGGGYVLATTVASKLRGDADDGGNHFCGGYGLMAYKLAQGNLRGWILGGAIVGTLASILKTFYINDVDFIRYNDEPCNVSNCRFPEMYIHIAHAPRENLK